MTRAAGITRSSAWFGCGDLHGRGVHAGAGSGELAERGMRRASVVRGGGLVVQPRPRTDHLLLLCIQHSQGGVGRIDVRAYGPPVRGGNAIIPSPGRGPRSSKALVWGGYSDLAYGR